MLPGAHAVWLFWLILGRYLHFFLVLLLWTLSNVCLLRMLSYDISLWETKKGLYLWEYLLSISFQHYQ